MEDGRGAEAEIGVEAEGVPLTITPPLDKHWPDVEVSEIGWKGIVPKAIACVVKVNLSW